MSTLRPGEFSEAARQAIYQAGDFRCIGCGRTDLNTHHRRRRGMGGTSERLIGHPANGVPLCGSGTVGCHAWAHSNHRDALQLGWNLPDDGDPFRIPFYDMRFGWRLWVLADDHCPLVAFVQPDELEGVPAREDAVRRLHRARPIGL